MNNPIAQSPFAHRLSDTRPAVSSGVNITDLSALPRTGFKGRGTSDWLASQVATMPAAPNRAAFQGDGAAIAWLGGQEYLALPDPEGNSTFCASLTQAWEKDRTSGAQGIGFPLPREDSHSWLWITGTDVPVMMAKICGVDLRPDVFAEENMAQTVVARIGAILLRRDRDGEFGLYMLSDFASGHYLWDVLQDAAAEYDGGFV
ncbi:N-methylglutamate dehydrogenase subunit D [Shimia gijangensis]|uniref:N-methylglutamate dehydrogenase subunit D n=1 Tax=Shimia gijangensis TaxID=1470563 RepID=A0A1M6TAT9_9RHOB|nr:hypothetical protein [Shimia gijangensis]SHK54080.1 N-methylglutamate dehydrogenase subunit D [Shimia gijangensis]